MSDTPAMSDTPKRKQGRTVNMTPHAWAELDRIAKSEMRTSSAQLEFMIRHHPRFQPEPIPNLKTP